MARSKISSASKSLANDDGTVLFPVVNGEQLRTEFTLDWLTSLNGFNVHARIIEAVNDGAGTKPTEVKVGGVRRTLTISNGYIRDVDDGDNKFSVVIPWDIVSGFDPQPLPDRPVYAFIDIEVGEPGTGDITNPVGMPVAPDKQVWKPVRGLVSIDYSPTESI